MAAASARAIAAAAIGVPLCTVLLLAFGVTAGRHALGSGTVKASAEAVLAEAHQGGDATPPLRCAASVEQLVRGQREELREVLAQRDLFEDPPRVLGPALLPDLVADLGVDRGHLL